MVACYAVDEALLFFPFLFLFFFSLAVSYSRIRTQIKPHLFTKSLFFDLLKRISPTCIASYAKVKKKSLGKVAKDVAQMFDYHIIIYELYFNKIRY